MCKDIGKLVRNQNYRLKLKPENLPAYWIFSFYLQRLDELNPKVKNHSSATRLLLHGSCSWRAKHHILPKKDKNKVVFTFGYCRRCLNKQGDQMLQINFFRYSCSVSVHILVYTVKLTSTALNTALKLQILVHLEAERTSMHSLKVDQNSKQNDG